MSGICSAHKEFDKSCITCLNYEFTMKEKECKELKDIIRSLHNDIGIAHDVAHERLKDANIVLLDEKRNG